MSSRKYVHFSDPQFSHPQNEYYHICPPFRSGGGGLFRNLKQEAKGDRYENSGCGEGGWGWVRKGQRELCATNVLYFDGSAELPEYMHLSKLIKMYIEDLCVPLHVNYTPVIQGEKQNWTNESYHQGSATSLL